MSLTPPPPHLRPKQSAMPSELEVRKHFSMKLSPDARLMRVPQTTIWVLEDGTLLWDWRNGYADLTHTKHGQPRAAEPQREPISINADVLSPSALKCIMFVTGPAASGKSALVDKMHNAAELEVDSDTTTNSLVRRVRYHSNTSTLVFTSQYTRTAVAERLEAIAEHFKLQFFNINLTRK